jgi:glycosyltransferase involved in cell wall biosynthesis
MGETLTAEAAILLPVSDFNDYFQECLHSITKSSNHLRIYIIMDEAVDAPRNLLEIKNENLHFLVYPKGKKLVKGIGGKLNFALKHVSENVIFRMDADDIWLKNREAEQIMELQNHSVVASEPLVIDSRGRKIPNMRPKIPIGRVWEPLFLITNPINHPSVAIKKEVLENVGGYRESYPEDLDLWLRLINADIEIFMSGSRYIKYRRHKNQISVLSKSNSDFDPGLEEEYKLIKEKFGVKSNLSQAQAFCRDRNCLRLSCSVYDYLNLVTSMGVLINKETQRRQDYVKRIAFEALIWLHGHNYFMKGLLSLIKTFGFTIILAALIRFLLQSAIFKIFRVK